MPNALLSMKHQHRSFKGTLREKNNLRQTLTSQHLNCHNLPKAKEQHLHKTWSKLLDVSWTTFPTTSTGNNIYNTITL